MSEQEERQLIRSLLDYDNDLTKIMLSVLRTELNDSAIDKINTILQGTESTIDNLIPFVMRDVLELVRVHVSLSSFVTRNPTNIAAFRRDAQRRASTNIQKLFLIDRVPIPDDKTAQSVWSAIRSSSKYQKQKAPSIHFSVKTAILIAARYVDAASAKSIFSAFDPRAYLQSPDVYRIARIFVTALRPSSKPLANTCRFIADEDPAFFPQMYKSLHFILLRTTNTAPITNVISMLETEYPVLTKDVVLAYANTSRDIFFGRFSTAPIARVETAFTLYDRVRNCELDAITQYMQVAYWQQSDIFPDLVYACIQKEATGGTWDDFGQFKTELVERMLQHDLVLVQPLLEARDRLLVILESIEARRGARNFRWMEATQTLAASITHLRELDRKICVWGAVYDILPNKTAGAVIDLESGAITQLILYAERVVAYLHKQAYTRHQL